MMSSASMVEKIVLSSLLAALAGACEGDVDGAGNDAASGPTADADPLAPDGAPGAIDAAGAGADAPPQVNFSFFVTSLDTMRLQSGSQDGFGGNLGGLAGADQICQTAAANVGFGYKTWRAFLSVTNDGTGQPVNAIDRIGNGPWYDRNGRLVAMNKTGLLQTRPDGDAQTKNDLPDENGVPGTSLGDTHDVMTGSNSQGQLDSPGNAAATCFDWTSTDETALTEEKVRLGHSWPAMSGQGWIQAHRMRGCGPGVNLIQNGPGTGNTVGAGGGWGAIYCFALEP